MLFWFGETCGRLLDLIYWAYSRTACRIQGHRWARLSYLEGGVCERCDQLEPKR